MSRAGPDAPQVVLCDVQSRSGTDGLRVVEAATAAGCRAIVLTSFDRSSLMRAAFEGGAAGFLDKGAEMSTILAAVRAVAAGGTAFSAAVLDAARRRPKPPSGREIAVLTELHKGATSDEIGARLGISARTVESHLRRLFDRYGVLSRTELAVLALREGWIDAGPAGAGTARCRRRSRSRSSSSVPRLPFVCSTSQRAGFHSEPRGSAAVAVGGLIAGALLYRRSEPAAWFATVAAAAIAAIEVVGVVREPRRSDAPEDWPIAAAGGPGPRRSRRDRGRLCGRRPAGIARVRVDRLARARPARARRRRGRRGRPSERAGIPPEWGHEPVPRAIPRSAPRERTRRRGVHRGRDARRAVVRSRGADRAGARRRWATLAGFARALADELLPTSTAMRRRGVEDERARLAAELHARCCPTSGAPRRPPRRPAHRQIPSRSVCATPWRTSRS